MIRPTMMRATIARAGSAVLVSLALALAAPALAQTQAEGQMRLYIQQLEERVRQLTGDNERLVYEVNQLRGQLGMPPLAAAEATGDVTGGDLAAPAETTPAPGDEQSLGMLSVSPDDPLIAPDGAVEEPGTGQPSDGQPVDLSALAGGPAVPEFGNPVPPGQDPGLQTAGIPVAPSPQALSGSARDEYDLAYGYILTGDYDRAEQSFKAWLAAFPGDPQQPDAEFWLGESYLQQGQYRDAANAFLAVYKATPNGNKGPDALLKLGMSLAALGETKAACATFGEIGRKYQDASQALMSRVHGEEGRAGC